MIAAKGGDFNNYSTGADVDYWKAPADDAGVAKALPNLLWRRSGGDVEVLRALP